MKAKLARLMAAVALLLTGLGTVGSPPWIGDEPEAMADMID